MRRCIPIVALLALAGCTDRQSGPIHYHTLRWADADGGPPLDEHLKAAHEIAVPHQSGWDNRYEYFLNQTMRSYGYRRVCTGCGRDFH